MSLTPLRSILGPRALPASRRYRAQKAYDLHVPLSGFERGFLAVGSAVAALANPYRHGETTAGSALPRMRDQMLASASGRAILRERPRISTQTVDLVALRSLPPGTLGRAYVDWLDANKCTPDSRDPVRFIDDPELAYVMQRYRESHDLYHVLLGFPTSVGAELVVKTFEFANNRLPMTGLSAMFGPLRLKSATRRRLLSTYGSWAWRCGIAAEPMIAVYWEKHWQTAVSDLKRELGVSDPPISWTDYRASSPAARARRVAEIEAEEARRVADTTAAEAARARHAPVTEEPIQSVSEAAPTRSV